jgi:hypothetical protein
MLHEAAQSVVFSQQRFDALAQPTVPPAGLVEQRGPLDRIVLREGGSKDFTFGHRETLSRRVQQ